MFLSTSSTPQQRIIKLTSLLLRRLKQGNVTGLAWCLEKGEVLKASLFSCAILTLGAPRPPLYNSKKKELVSRMHLGETGAVHLEGKGKRWVQPRNQIKGKVGERQQRGITGCSGGFDHSEVSCCV